jgi:hypothetical protein
MIQAGMFRRAGRPRLVGPGYRLRGFPIVEIGLPSWRSVYAAAAPKARAISTGGVERHAHLDALSV